MKKIFAIILVLCMTFTLTACSAQSGGETSSSGQGTSTEGAQQDAASDDNGEQEAANDSDATQEDGMEAENGNTDADNPSEDGAGNKVLVAYFSCTGNTEGIVEHIVSILGADVYQIVPEEPYTDADLNYNDSSSRTTIEMNDSTSRPAISGAMENMEDYDIIFIGYPIWWGQAPHIVYTFFESYDFSGKTIVPFCTSGSSGVGSSATNLHGSAADSTVWLDGTRLASSASQSDIEDWLGGLGLDIFEN